MARLCSRSVFAAVVALTLSVSLSIPERVSAHDAPTLGYSHITAAGDTLTWTLYFDPSHLDTFMQLDSDGSGTVSEGEIDARRDDLAELVLPNVWVTDTKTAQSPTGTVGAVGLTQFGSTGLHSEGFAELDAGYSLVAVPVTFRFDDLQVDDVQLTYNLFVVEAFGEHINIAEIDIAGTSTVFQFDPGIPTVTIGEVIAGTVPGDSVGTTNTTTSTVDSAVPTSAKRSESRNFAPVALGVTLLALIVGFALYQRRTARAGAAPQAAAGKAKRRATGAVNTSSDVEALLDDTDTSFQTDKERLLPRS